ncbi:hypothetical protein EXIGLDRAFT_781133 [Exidia glandulosa HHB12029]|uniref:Zn(2)-C6 fungal-type domain-containing protein n=1 Tax=Exidia glandulosa HHB12029 TaxID=1314781 RepID=A0A165BCL2_EXIGL|nr:hypothetical protein EXIGLDRAFT_781133 [Exidia glandulosa HHB12029]
MAKPVDSPVSGAPTRKGGKVGAAKHLLKQQLTFSQPQSACLHCVVAKLRCDLKSADDRRCSECSNRRVKTCKSVPTADAECVAALLKLRRRAIIKAKFLRASKA